MGVSSPICLFLGKAIWSELILMMVHSRFVGSLALNIVRRGTTKRFWSMVDCVPVRL